MIYPVPKPKPKVRGKRGAPTGRPRTRLKNRTRMKQINRKRGGHAFPHRRDPEYCEWVRRQPCLLAGRQRTDLGWHFQGDCVHICFTAVRQVCHVKSRGAGGDDRKNVVAMCPRAHAEQHRIGIRSFECRWNVDLKLEADQLFRGWVDRGGAHD